MRLSRLKFLAGGFVGGAFGTALAFYDSGRFDARSFALAQTAITAFHLMTHYANDYFDRHGDALALRTPYSGGSGALVDGSLPPWVGLVAALSCASIGLAASAGLAWFTHVPLAAIFGLAILVFAWSYSAPPLRLLARGLGEFDTALVVAILVPLCAYAAQGPVPGARALASTLPGAAAMFAMMLAVEYPDLAADTASGKHNLVVRAGPRRARVFGIAAVLATYAAVGFAILRGAPLAFALYEIVSLPPAYLYARALATRCAANPAADAALAGRGVAFFFMVALCGMLAYATAGAGSQSNHARSTPHGSAVRSAGANTPIAPLARTATK